MPSLRILPVLAAAATLVVAASGTASANHYLPPEITFTTSPHTVTAVIHNPNTSGICWASIGVDGSVQEFANHSGAGYAPAGETITVAREGLAPGEYGVQGGCGGTTHDPHQSRLPTQWVTVPDDAPLPSGSAGSS